MNSIVWSAASAACGPPPPGTLPTKRVFRTVDGRIYEQDVTTGHVAWCAEATIAAAVVARVAPPSNGAPGAARGRGRGRG